MSLPRFDLSLRRALAAAACAPLLAGCYEIASGVPAVTEASRVKQLALEPGRYCSVDVTLDARGRLDGADVSAEDCVILSVSGGTMTVSSPNPADTDTIALDAAELPRGAMLLQSRGEGWGYNLMIAFVRAGSLAILDEPRRTPDMELLAASSGVALAGLGEQAEGAAPPEIEIVSGKPEAVLAFVGQAAGAMLDAARGEEGGLAGIGEGAIYYVRAGSGASAAPDAGAARKEVEALLQSITRAAQGS